MLQCTLGGIFYILHRYTSSVKPFLPPQMEFSAPFPVYLALRHSHYYSPSVFKKLDICIPDGELMIARTTASGPWHSACHSAVAWLTALALSDDSFAKDFIKHVFCHIKILSFSACFGSTYTKIGTIQRRLAWPLRKDDTQICEAFHIFRQNTL